MTTTPDPGDLYEATRARFAATVRAAGDGLATRVPSAPAWTVQDTLSHLVGIVADIQDGRMDGVGTDEWTRAQTTARRDLPITELLSRQRDTEDTIEIKSRLDS